MQKPINNMETPESMGADDMETPEMQSQQMHRIAKELHGIYQELHEISKTLKSQKKYK